MVISWWFFLAFVLFLDCTSSLVSQFLIPSFSAWISLHRLVPVIQAFLAIVFCLSFQSNIFVALFIHPLSYLIVISTAICGTLTIVWIQLLYPRLYVVLLLLCSQFFYIQHCIRFALTVVFSNFHIHCTLWSHYCVIQLLYPLLYVVLSFSGLLIWGRMYSFPVLSYILSFASPWMMSFKF